MAKFVLLMICIVGVYLKLSASASIECDYITGGYWNILQKSYRCSVNNDPSITTQESATITSISGNHQSGKTNSDVDGFAVSSKTINYFPRGLETFFKNIKAIQIYDCKLKEIHQEDLKPFSKLVEIYLYHNSLEVLEEGLFDFNPNLELINFFNNKIVHIEPKAFGHLNKLNNLWLGSNTCINKDAPNSISEVKNVIQTAKSQCINSEFSSLKEKLENLEKDSKTLNSENFSEKLLTFEKVFSSSKFSNFRPLNYKFEALKNPKVSPDTKVPQNCCQFDQISIIEHKLENLTQHLQCLAKSYSNISNNVWIAHEGVNSVQNVIKGLQNDTKKGQSDLSLLRSGQVDIKNSQKILDNDIKTIQNDLKTSITDQKASIANLVPKISNVQNILKSTITEVDTKIIKNLNDLKSSQKTLISEVMSTNEVLLAKISSKIDTILTSQDEVRESQVYLNMTISYFKDGQNNNKVTQNDIKQAQNDLKVAIKSDLSQITSNLSNHSDVLDMIQSSQNDTKAELDDLKNSQTDLSVDLKDLKSTQETFQTFLNDLGSMLTSLKDFTMTPQDDMKGSISDIVSSLSGIKSDQKDIKTILKKFKNTQNEQDDLKGSNSEERSLSSHGSQFQERFTKFENENAKKLGKIEKDLEVTRSKILLSIDSKVNVIEDRILDRIEELLEEKLAKFVENFRKDVG